MKNILIIVLVIVSLFLLAYSFIKADEADKARIAADAQRSEVERLRDEAVSQANEARLAQAEAESQAERAYELAEELAKCQSK